MQGPKSVAKLIEEWSEGVHQAEPRGLFWALYVGSWVLGHAVAATPQNSSRRPEMSLPLRHSCCRAERAVIHRKKTKGDWWCVTDELLNIMTQLIGDDATLDQLWPDWRSDAVIFAADADSSSSSASEDEASDGAGAPPDDGLADSTANDSAGPIVIDGSEDNGGEPAPSSGDDFGAEQDQGRQAAAGRHAFMRYVIMLPPGAKQGSEPRSG